MAKSSGPSRIFGYVRQSAAENDTDNQLVALRDAGISFTGVFSDAHDVDGPARPNFDSMMSLLHVGDMVVVTKLDKLGFNLRHALSTFDFLASKGVFVRTLSPAGLDTSSLEGQRIVDAMRAVVQADKDFVRERTLAGLFSARSAGRIGGRQEKFTDDQIQSVMHLNNTQAAKALGMSKTQYIKRLQRLQQRGVVHAD